MTFEGRSVRPGDVAFGSDGRFLDKEGRLTGLCRGGGGGAGAAGTDAALYLVPLSQLKLVCDSCFGTLPGAGIKLMWGGGEAPLRRKAVRTSAAKVCAAGGGGG